MVVTTIVKAIRCSRSILSTISRINYDTEKIIICPILRYWVILLVSNIYAKQTCLKFQYNTFLIKDDEPSKIISVVWVFLSVIGSKH